MGVQRGMKRRIINGNMITLLISLIFCNIFCQKESESKDTKDITPSINSAIICKEDEIIESINKNKHDIYSSSNLKSNKGISYLPNNMFDDSKNTCWCPTEDGLGEFVIFRIPYGIKGILITNGVALNKKLHQDNNRIKEIYLAFITETYYPENGMEEYDICGKHKYMTIAITDAQERIFLRDTINPQDIIFYKISRLESNDEFWKSKDRLFNFKNSKSLYLVIGILDIYKGEKYNDTCITDIKIVR